MIKSYIKIALRNLKNHKYYSLVSILGLSLGLASFLLISFYNLNELSYDNHHQNSDRIYRVVTILEKDGIGERSASCPFPMAEKIHSTFPEKIEKTLRLFNYQTPSLPLKIEDKTVHEKSIFLCDTTIQSFFDIDLIKGDKKKVFKSHNTILLSESFANKYFKDKNPIGDSVFFYYTRSYLEITGVYKNFRHQSHLHPSALVNMQTFTDKYGKHIENEMVWNPCWTYLMLKSNTDPDEIESKLPKFIDKTFEHYDVFNIFLQSLPSIHLNSHMSFEIEQNGNEDYVVALFWIAIIIILLASTNFINLTTANAVFRSKEIGVRKTIGAHKGQVFVQFIIESLILSLTSLLVALAIVEIALPIMEIYIDNKLVFNIRYSVMNFILFVLIGCTIGIFSGIYPSLYLSSFNPINAIKGIFKKRLYILKARRALIIFQFIISVTLIIASLVIYNQLRYLQKMDLGFERDNIVMLEVNDTHIPWKYDEFKQDLLNNPQIAYVTGMFFPIGVSHNTMPFGESTDKKVKKELFPYNSVNYDFIKTFKINIITGSDFSEHNNSNINGILINEEMVKFKGWTNENAIGRILTNDTTETKVIGVFENFYVSSLLNPSVPFVLKMAHEKKMINYTSKYVAVRLNENNRSVINFIEQIWNKYNINKEFSYTMLNDDINRLYSNEYKVIGFMIPFTILAIIISFVGLMGLTTYTCQQRSKEIGIRKVIGASELNIIKLITKEYLILAVIGNTIAWPVAYYFLNRWLNSFDQHTVLSPWYFILSLIITSALAAIVSSFKAYTTSKKNPAEIIRRIK